MQTQMTLTTELDRLSRSSDIRVLQRICLFMSHFIRYLLDFFDSPDDRIEDFNEWWKEFGEQLVLDAEECRCEADSTSSSRRYTLG